MLLRNALSWDPGGKELECKKSVQNRAQCFECIEAEEILSCYFLNQASKMHLPEPLVSAEWMCSWIYLGRATSSNAAN